MTVEESDARIDVCICTFRRPQVVQALLSVEAAARPSEAVVNLIVVDNDDTPTAQDAVRRAAGTMTLPVRYVHAPGANISIARNAALDTSTGDLIAFLDDDETVDHGWLTALVARQMATGADAVFGHSHAVYGPGTRTWMARGDFHSQIALPRGDVIETGHTCNALLRWKDAPWRTERFDPARGRSGGEDTEFFFRLRRLGARYAIADDSIVREAVPSHRARVDWLLRRRFRIGQSYAAIAEGGRARADLFARALPKAVYCAMRGMAASWSPERRTFWMMRGTMHAGICAGCLDMRQSDLYRREPQ